MKRSLLCALLALLFLFASAGAENSRQALYTARLTRDTTMRAEPSPDAQADFESDPAPETEAGVAPESDSGAPSPDECGGAADQPADSE